MAELSPEDRKLVEWIRADPTRQARFMLPWQQRAATELGHCKTCRLPGCRRARRCVGSHPKERIGTGHWEMFPPCVADDATQMALNVKVGEIARDLAARGGAAVFAGRPARLRSVDGAPVGGPPGEKADKATAGLLGARQPPPVAFR